MPSQKSDDRLNKLINKGKPSPPRRRRRRRSKVPDVDLTRLDEMSESELVAVAHIVGYPNASRQLLKEDLIGLILGEVNPPDDPLEETRERIFEHVTNNKRIMPSRMPCDLHCPTCPHRMVVECLVVNHDLLE